MIQFEKSIKNNTILSFDSLENFRKWFMLASLQSANLGSYSKLWKGQE